MSDKRVCAEKRAALTAERLRELLIYDPDTGMFQWKPRPYRRALAQAGSINRKGYRVITIGDRQYNASHLAWLYVYGEWPDDELDHKDTNRANDRIDNLREAEPVENRANVHPASNSGFKGVRVKRKRAEASIVTRGKGIYLGTFDTPEEAAAAYHAKAVELYGEFARDK